MKYNITSAQINGEDATIVRKFSRGAVAENGILNLGVFDLAIDVSQADLSQGASITLQLVPLSEAE